MNTITHSVTHVAVRYRRMESSASTMSNYRRGHLLAYNGVESMFGVGIGYAWRFAPNLRHAGNKVGTTR